MVTEIALLGCVAAFSRDTDYLGTPKTNTGLVAIREGRCFF